jgi:hypothetical protein
VRRKLRLVGRMHPALVGSFNRLRTESVLHNRRVKLTRADAWTLPRELGPRSLPACTLECTDMYGNAVLSAVA